VEFAFDVAPRRTVALRVVHGWKQLSCASDEQAEEVLRQLSETLDPWRDKFPGVEMIEEAVGRPGRFPPGGETASGSGGPLCGGE
jgi:hypothetical protein